MCYFRIILQVAGRTLCAGDNGFIVRPFRKFRRTVHDRFDKHHILFEQGRVMAGVTVDALMLTGLPTVERIFHEMAVQAELGLILGIVVQMQGADPHPHNHQSD